MGRKIRKCLSPNVKALERSPGLWCIISTKVANVGSAVERKQEQRFNFFNNLVCFYLTMIQSSSLLFNKIKFIQRMALIPEETLHSMSKDKDLKSRRYQ